MIIVVANSKGGVGKSTLSVHLAAWLREQGHRVTFADCDAQESSSQWIREALPELGLGLENRLGGTGDHTANVDHARLHGNSWPGPPSKRSRSC